MASSIPSQHDYHIFIQLRLGMVDDMLTQILVVFLNATEVSQFLREQLGINLDQGCQT